MGVDEDGSEVLRGSDGELRTREASGLPWKRGLGGLRQRSVFKENGLNRVPSSGAELFLYVAVGS